MAPEDPGAEAASPGAVLPETLAPAISVPVAPYEALPTLGTSIANVTAGRQQTTGTNKDPRRSKMMQLQAIEL
jgi:hypothetical protein